MFALKILFNAVLKFVADNFREIVFVVLLAAVAYGAMHYQKMKDEQVIIQLKLDWKAAEDKRAEGINARVEEVERNAQAAAARAKEEIEKAENKAKDTLKQWELDKKKRNEERLGLQARLKEMESKGDTSSKEFQDIKLRLSTMLDSYQISNEAVLTINKLVGDYK
jgi:hypothetical protein